MTDTNLNTTEKTENFNIKEEVYKYIYYWKWFLLSIVVFVGASYLYLRKSANIYNTEAVIQILEPSSGIELPRSSFVFNRSTINLENEIKAITAYPIIAQVVERLNLNYSFYAKGTIKTTLISDFPLPLEHSESITQGQTGSYYIDFFENSMQITTNKGIVLNFDSYNTNSKAELPFSFSKDPNTKTYLNGKTFIINVGTIKNTILSLKNRLKIAQIGQRSDLLTIGLSGENPIRSKSIINTLMDVYKMDGVKDRQQISRTTIEFIDNRFLSLVDQLDSIENRKEAFQKQNNFVDLKETASLSLQSLSEYEKNEFNESNQLQISKTIISTLSDDKSLLDRIPVNMLEVENLNALIQQYNSSIDEYYKLQLSAGEKNPSLLYVKDKLNNYKENIKSSLNAYIRDLEFSLQKTSERKLKFNSKISSAPSQEKLYKGINRQVDIKESLYIYLLQKREESAINLAITEPSIKILDFALTASGAISPRPKIIYAAAVALGLLIPFLILFTITLLDTKIHSKPDVDKLKLNIPVIAEIPTIKNENDLFFKNPNNNNVLSESFRILSSNVNFLLPQDSDKGKVIFSTSTIKGEGKTFVSINLSLALSSINKKVLLIGSDLRNPQIHTQLGVDKNTKGLSNYLFDHSFDWRDALINGFDKHKHHHILLSGSIPPNPANLLTNGRFEQLLAEARKEYDYIVVDTAPTILVTDTILIAKHADATVFVVRADYTDKKLLNFSKDLVASEKMHNVAYVLNGVGTRKGYGYGYKYGYNYGYGYGYSSDDS